MRKSTIKEDMIYTNIGRDQRMETVGCKIQLDNSAYEYDGDDRHTVQRLMRVLSKYLRWAWLRLQRKTRHHKKKSESLFLPRALKQGKNQIYKNYLPRLQKQKIWGYINLNIPIQTIPGQLIQRSLTKLSNKQYRQAFQHIQSLQSNNGKFNEQRYSTSRYETKRKDRSLQGLGEWSRRHQGPINVTIQTIYIDRKASVKNQGKGEMSSPSQYHQYQTKIKHNNWQFPQQYDTNKIHFVSSNKNRNQNNSSHRSKKDSVHRSQRKSSRNQHGDSFNPQDGCSYCSILESFSKKHKHRNQPSLLTTQTFLQDHNF